VFGIVDTASFGVKVVMGKHGLGVVGLDVRKDRYTNFSSRGFQGYIYVWQIRKIYC
jgi:hypothetical protein